MLQPQEGTGDKELAPAAPKSKHAGLPALTSPQTQILLLFSFPQQSHACLTSAAARRFLCELPHSNPASEHLQISQLQRVQQEGCSNSHGEVAFINCCALHPLYQLFWTHTFPTQAHARHLRVDNLPRQAVNTSHLMLPLRIMCLPVSPVM